MCVMVNNRVCSLDRKRSPDCTGQQCEVESMWSIMSKLFPERITTASHLTFAGPRGQVSDQNLAWYDILANEIIRTGLNVWQ